MIRNIGGAPAGRWTLLSGPHRNEFQREGWYLFGFIPLYVRDITMRTSEKAIKF